MNQYLIDRRQPRIKLMAGKPGISSDKIAKGSPGNYIAVQKDLAQT